MLRPAPFLFFCCLAFVQQRVGAGTMVTVDVNGDLIVTPPAGRAVLVQGVDVPAALAGLDGRLGALEIKLQIALARMPTPPTGPPPLTPGQVPRIGQDLLGNLLLITAPSNQPRMHARHKNKIEKKKDKHKNKQKKHARRTNLSN